MNNYDPIFSVQNKTAIITGASSGLGVTFAEILATRGANVVLSARRIEKLNDLKDSFDSNHLSSHVVQCDVTDSAQVATMFSKAEEVFGRVDILVNNAGQIAEAGSVPENITDAMFEQTVKVNLMGLWYCCKEAGNRMLNDGKGGSIINLSSVAGLNGMRGMPAAYQATKGAVTNLTKSLAANWADRGVRVNAIAPGVILTDRVRAMLPLDDPVRVKTPLGPSEPEDVAPLALYLASDESRQMTGMILPLDGGASAV